MQIFYWIVAFLASPEILAVLCLFVPPARKYLLRMVEDSDGDPHHTDGFFVAILWCSTLCVRASIGIAIYDIAHAGTNIGYVIAFLTYGTALLGVRAVENKLNLGIFKKEEEAK